MPISPGATSKARQERRTRGLAQGGRNGADEGSILHGKGQDGNAEKLGEGEHFKQEAMNMKLDFKIQTNLHISAVQGIQKRQTIFFV